ncbi:MAG TPA: prephenate dehydrogenase/arogenate dehydrogenase family protein [Nitrospiria bacterium]|nr:prephenate dehydrogenase/arogenate dehydrogenase family protein [Nitrospiria bacterium]
MALIGVGLMGGSLGMAVKRKRLVGEIVCYAPDPAALKRAVRRRAIDRTASSASEAVRGADLIVLATPVGLFEPLVKECAPSMKPGALLTDVGSVKGALIGRIEALLPPEVIYLSAHPLAGREQSGIEAASPGLFEGCRCLLTPGALTRPDALTRLTRFWERLGAAVTTLDPYEHDRYVAFVSHLPHLVAYALVECAMDASREAPALLGFSAGGFRDFTRIAASSPEMWRDICLENRAEILKALERYRATLERYRRFIESGDGASLEQAFRSARRVKTGLPS